MKRLQLAAALLVVTTLIACGGSDDDGDETTAATTSTTSTMAATGPCSPVEELDVENFGAHREGEFTLADYETNPPAGGDHNPTPLEPGGRYDESAPLGEAVHLLEHGAVIAWTNGLAKAEEKELERELRGAFDEGYYQLAIYELAGLDVPFALSAWGALQRCEEFDATVVKPFLEQWYASPKSAESAIACQGPARALPPC